MTDLRTEGGKLMAGAHEVLKGWESFSGWYWFGVERIADTPGLVCQSCYGLTECGFRARLAYYDRHPAKVTP